MPKNKNKQNKKARDKEYLLRKIERIEKEDRSFLFSKLVLKDLTILENELKSNPELINLQDIDDRTLLHHAAEPALDNEYVNCTSRNLDFILNTANINFFIKDKEGNTPVHAAVRASNTSLGYKNFTKFITAAAKHGFDFSTLGKNGRTILQEAIFYYNSYENGKRFNNVKNVLDNVPNPAINTLSAEGATAFFYAVDNNFLDEAHTLLDHGADFLLCGSKLYDPMPILFNKNNNTAILKFDEEDDDMDDTIAVTNESSQKIINLKNRIQSKYSDYVEIRKNALLLAQAKKTCTLFNWIPKELLVTIVGYTRNEEIHTQEEAEDIARNYLENNSR